MIGARDQHEGLTMRSRWGRFTLFTSVIALCATSAFAQGKKAKPKTPPKEEPAAAAPAATTPPAKDAKGGKPAAGTAAKGGKKDDVEDLGGDEPEVKAGAPSPQFQKAKKFLDQE